MKDNAHNDCDRILSIEERISRHCEKIPLVGRRGPDGYMILPSDESDNPNR